MGRLSLFPWQEDTAMYRECSAYLRTLAPVAGVSGGDRWLHPTVFCGMQLLVRAWDVCFWCQSPQMLTLIFMILIFTILDANELTCFAGPTVRLLDDLQCVVRSGSVHISVLDDALWDAWQVRCGMGEIGLSLLLFNRSVQIVVWYLWCWDLFYVILVCIRFHVIFVSCDCIMKGTFVSTQVVNKLLLLLSACSVIFCRHTLTLLCEFGPMLYKLPFACLVNAELANFI